MVSAGRMQVERWKTKVERASGRTVLVYYVRRRAGSDQRWETKTFATDKELVPAAKIQADDTYTRWRAEAKSANGDTRTYRRATLPIGAHAVEAVAASYIEGRRLKGRGVVTIRGYQDTLNDYLLPWLSQVHISDIRYVGKEAVLGLHDDLLGDGITSKSGAPLSFRSKVKIFAALKALLKHAAKRGWIDSIPGPDIDLEISSEEQRRRERMREERALSTREVGSLLATADLMAQDSNVAVRTAWATRYRAFIYVAAYTGARASEVLGLTHGSLTKYPGDLWIKQRIDKDGNTGGVKRKRSLRRVPLHPRAAATIRDMIQARGLVDPSPSRFLFETVKGTVILYSSIHGRCWVKLVERNNALAATAEGKARGIILIEAIDGRALHAFRRHAAGVLYAMGMSVAEIGDHLGQESEAATRMYISEQEDPGADPVAPTRRRVA